MFLVLIFGECLTKREEEKKKISQLTKEFKIRKIWMVDKPALGCETPSLAKSRFEEGI